MCRFHAVMMHNCSASPSPSSGTPPPPAKQHVSVCSTSSDVSVITSTATHDVFSSIGARCWSSNIIRISGSPNSFDHACGETISSLSRSASGEGGVIALTIALRSEQKACTTPPVLCSITIESPAWMLRLRRGNIAPWPLATT